MRSTAPKTSRRHSASRSSGFFRGAGSPGFFRAVMRPPSGTPVVQAKLSVSKPGDPLEREADRTADTVSRMPDEQVQRAERAGTEPEEVPSATPTVQRAAAEEELQRAADEGVAPPELQRSTSRAGRGAAPAAER